MRVLVLQTEMNPGNLKWLFNHGSLAIATYLKNKGHEICYRSLSDRTMDKDQLLAGIAPFEPDLIGFSVTTDEWHYVSRLAGWIKERFPVPIICGGAHATMAPEKVLADKSIDMVCGGEGELAIEELCYCLDNDKDYRHIENIRVKVDGRIYSNPVRQLIENLDTLPFPDPGLVDFPKILQCHCHMATFMVGRGCPFDCTYCINRCLHQLYLNKGNPVRRRTPERIIEAICATIAQYPGIKGIGFGDDVLSLDRNWFREFCSLYAQRVALPWVCFMRVEGIDRQFLTLFKEAGGYWLDIGVESGNEWLRREVLGRRMSNQRIIEAFKLVDEFGIGTTSLCMVGLPFETPEMAEETIELNRKLKPSFLFGGPFQPYPGTQLREICLERGWLREDAPFIDRNESLLDLPAFPKAQINHYIHKLNHAGIALQIQKYPCGEFDFLAHFEEAEVEQQSEGDVEVSTLSFREFIDRRFVLKTTPPARITFQLNIPKGAFLNFEIGFDEYSTVNRNCGVLFVIELAHGPGYCHRQRLFSCYVNPWRNPEDQGWHNYELPLDDFGGEDVNVSFITRPGPYVGEGKVCAAWRRPWITRIPSVRSRAQQLSSRDSDVGRVTEA